MVRVCVDSGEEQGTGAGLLTVGKKYTILREFGGYYEIRCDNGEVLTKSKTRFSMYQNEVPDNG